MPFTGHGVTMARKGRKRRFNLRKVKVASAVAAGALATEDVVSGAITSAAADKLRFVSLNASYTWTNIGSGVDDGCTFGVAHSDYSAAEIEECLEQAASIDLGDKIAQEKGNRLVREIGTISAGGAGAAGGQAFNDGKPTKTRLNWLMSAGDTLSLWIRNASGTVWTTGSGVAVSGDLWVRD